MQFNGPALTNSTSPTYDKSPFHRPRDMKSTGPDIQVLIRHAIVCLCCLAAFVLPRDMRCASKPARLFSRLYHVMSISHQWRRNAARSSRKSSRFAIRLAGTDVELALRQQANAVSSILSTAALHAISLAMKIRFVVFIARCAMRHKKSGARQFNCRRDGGCCMIKPRRRHGW